MVEGDRRLRRHMIDGGGTICFMYAVGSMRLYELFFYLAIGGGMVFSVR